MSLVIEIATSDFHTTQAAVQGGADRIELCCNLGEGGTTASYGLIRQCREIFAVSLYPIIRVRGGDFLYTDEEFDCMYRDVQLCRELGCDGVVIGLLRRDGTVDIDRTARLVEAAYPLGVTFHRAFDRCADPFAALEALAGIGCERILTSGQQPVAIDGADLIAQLQQQSAGRIIIMPGSGVRRENIAWLAGKTGCSEFHASLRQTAASRMEYLHPAFAADEGSYRQAYIDPEEVKAMRAALARAFS